ncbi:Fructosamine kinase domain-containing protein [Trichoderma longibrachiatum]
MIERFGKRDAAQDLQTVDPQVLSVLPNVAELLEATYYTESPWAKGYRVRVRQTDGSEEVYFMKVSTNHHGKLALTSEFESTSTIHAITPDFCPKPIGCGTFETDANLHFYVCKFYIFAEGMPEPHSFCEKLARLNASSSSPDGKFGYHCATYNGDLPQDNTWCDSWEAFYAHGLRHVLKVREERAGRSPELEELLPALFDKVIPRLLRPLESDGRTIKPPFVHGDLWWGNSGIIDSEAGDGIAFDPSAFWGHNEYDLGNWRLERNRFTARYFEAYHAIIPKSEPVEDYDDRNALYSTRFDLNAAALYSDQEWYLRMAIDGIRRLVEAYPEGYTAGGEPSSL